MTDVVRIELDRRDPVYRAGEVVSGTVVLDGAAGQRARKVVLRTWWETRGRGTSVRGGKRAVVLHEGPPPEGATHRHPFRFVAPDAPFTYQGHHLAVEHVLQALIELPMAPDAEVEVPFRLIPGEAVAPVPDDLLAGDGSSPAASRPDRRVAMVGVLLLGVGVVTLPVPGFFIVLGGLAVLGFGLRKEIASSRAGKVSIEVEPRVVAPGDEVELTIGIFPPKPVAIQGVTVSLRAREICVSGSGKNRKTHRKVVHVEEKALIAETVLPGQLKLDLEASFVVPDLDIWSFKAHRNEIRWEVGVRVRIPSWPDWIGEVPVVVWPARRLPAAEPAAAIAPPPPAEPSPSIRALPASRPRPAPASAEKEPPSQGSLRRSPLPPSPSSVPARAPTSAFPTELPITPPVRPEQRDRPPAGGAVEEQAPSIRRDRGAEPVQAPTQTRDPQPDGDRLATAVEAILATRSHSPERQAALSSLMGTRVTIELVVDRIDRPFGRTRVPGFEEGRIVKGRLRGVGLDVEARVPTTRASEVAELQRGDPVTISGIVTGWERLPERPVIECGPLSDQ